MLLNIKRKVFSKLFNHTFNWLTFVFAQCCPHLVLDPEQQTLSAIHILPPEHHSHLPAGALFTHAGLGHAEPGHGHGGVQCRLCYAAHFVWKNKLSLILTRRSILGSDATTQFDCSLTLRL